MLGNNTERWRTHPPFIRERITLSLYFFIFTNQFVYNIHKPDDLVEKAGWIPGHIADAQKFADDGRTKVKVSQMWSNRLELIATYMEGWKKTLTKGRDSCYDVRCVIVEHYALDQYRSIGVQQKLSFREVKRQ